MPLTLANVGEENIIKKVGGNPETRKFLENLGFVAGGSVIVVSEIGGNVIVNVKESRVAVSKEMASVIDSTVEPSGVPVAVAVTISVPIPSGLAVVVLMTADC